MKVLVCLSVLVASTYAGFVSYPYIPDFSFHSGYGPLGSAYKPFYPGFYDYRLSLSPAPYYPYGFYPGTIASAPTFVHLIPADAFEGEKKPKSESDKPKGKDGKDEEPSMAAEGDGSKDNVEKAEEKDEADSAAMKSDVVEIESS